MARVGPQRHRKKMHPSGKSELDWLINGTEGRLFKLQG